VRANSDGCLTMRRLFMVLSPRSLPYARLALASLFLNAIEPFELILITDSNEDKVALSNEMHLIANGQGMLRCSWSVVSYSDLDVQEVERFERYENIRNFRRGHPCWRKITDPILLSSDTQEMIVLDPDIYFPNKFQFEPTPKDGLLLMWQRPSCLLPAAVVQNAFSSGVKLAHHTDIGVAQWRMPVELDWLDWLLGKLGSPNLPRSMHVESIVWAALALRKGGGYLDPALWVCWHRSQFKRVIKKMGASGPFILGSEDWKTMKCFHAGGEAKWWLEEARNRGLLSSSGSVPDAGSISPFVELSSRQFEAIEQRRRWLRRCGYYKLFS